MTGRLSAIIRLGALALIAAWLVTLAPNPNPIDRPLQTVDQPNPLGLDRDVDGNSAVATPPAPSPSVTATVIDATGAPRIVDTRQQAGLALAPKTSPPRDA